MKKKIFTAFSYFAALIVLHAAPNLIRNGDFRDLSSNHNQAPNNWYVLGGSASLDKLCGIDKKEKPEGSKSNSYRVTGNGLILQTVGPIVPGKSYELSCMMKAVDMPWLSEARFQIIWLDKNKREVMYEIESGGKKVQAWHQTYVWINSNVDWKKFDIPAFTAPENARYALIRFGRCGRDANGTTYFTDLTMTECAKADQFANRIATIPYGNKMEDGVIIDDFAVPESNAKAKHATEVQAYYNDNAMYFRFTAHQPSVGGEQFQESVKKNTSDGVELFLMPPNNKLQYHVLVTPSGKRWLLKENWERLGAWDFKNGRFDWENDEVKTSVVIREDQWIVDICIPYSSMGLNKAPAEGEVWRANFCRNVATRGQELSGWGKLGTSHFQKSDYFGKIIFSNKAPTISSIRVSPAEVTAEVKNNSNSRTKISITRVKHGENSATAENSRSFTIDPKSKKQITYSEKTTEKGMLWTEIRVNGKLVAKHFALPSANFITLDFNDPEKVRTQTVYLAVDHPFFISYKLNHNFPSKGYRSILHRHEKKVDCVIEVPEGVNFTGMIHDASAYGWNQSPRVIPSVKDVLYNGKKYKQYTFPMHMIINWNEPQWLFFYDCDLPAGQEFTGRMWFVVDGKVESETIKTYKTMEIGKVKKTFSRLPFNIGLMDAVTLINWFPKDTLKHYTALGFNCISVPVRPIVNKEFYTGDSPMIPEHYYDLLYQDFLKADFPVFMNTVSVSTGAPAHAWTRADLPDTVAIDKYGKKLTTGGYQGSPALCFNYRGPEYQKWYNRLVNSSAFGKYKITWLALDMELFHQYGFDHGCYCEKCLRLFKEFSKKHNRPDMEALDPRTATSDEFKKFWREFQTDAAEDFVIYAVNGVREKVKGAKSTSPWGEFTSQDYGSPSINYKKDSLNFFEMSVYHPAEGNYKKLLNTIRNFGSNRGKLATGLSYGQTGGCPDWFMRPEDCKESIFETMIFGTSNVVYYFCTYLEPLRMQKIVEALNTVVPFENIVLDGTLVEDVKASTPDLLLTHRVCGDESLLAVRTYYAQNNVKGVITFDKVSAAMNVYDCETGKKVGAVSPGKPYFTYSIEKKDCRLLYIGTESQWNARFK